MANFVLTIVITYLSMVKSRVKPTPTLLRRGTSRRARAKPGDFWIKKIPSEEGIIFGFYIQSVSPDFSIPPAKTTEYLPADRYLLAVNLVKILLD